MKREHPLRFSFRLDTQAWTFKCFSLYAVPHRLRLHEDGGGFQRVFLGNDRKSDAT